MPLGLDTITTRGRSRRRVFPGLWLGLWLVLSCCGPEVSRATSPAASRGQPFSSIEQRPLVKLGFLSRDPARAGADYEPLEGFLAARTPFRFQTAFATSPVQLLSMLEERIVDVAQLDHLTYLEARRRFEAVPLARPFDSMGKPRSRCVFVTSLPRITELSDLHGETLALGDAHSVVAHIVPCAELAAVGIGSGSVSLVQPDGHGTVLEMVSKGDVAAGAIDAEPRARAADRSLFPFHRCRPIPSPPVAVRGDLPSSVVSSIRRALLELDFEGRDERTGWPEETRYGFAPAEDADYDGVRAMVHRQAKTCGVGCHEPVLPSEGGAR